MNATETTAKVIGVMMHELGITGVAQEALVQYAAMLDEDQLQEFAKVLYVATTQQVAIESDAAYQKETAAIDAETNSQLEALLESSAVKSAPSV